MNLTNNKLEKKARKFYSGAMEITRWDVVEKEWQNLLDAPVNSAEELALLIEKYSELSSMMQDEMNWRYIKMTINADNEDFANAFQDFYADIMSNSELYDFKFQKKYYDSPYRKDLATERYAHFDKIVSNSIEIFREENTPLKVKEQELTSKYGSIFSKMTVNYKGEEKTLTQLTVHLKDQNREVREEVWHLIMNRVNEEADLLNQLFDELKTLRIEMAKNAGFDNYRDYMHKVKGRFSYTPEDLYRFHDAVEKVVVPFVKELNKERKEKLGVESIRPWDRDVDYDGKVLKPFQNVDEFVEKAVTALYKVKPEFGQVLNQMKNTGLLDLENRKGKAPGGYCASIDEYAASFIFMNAVGLHQDVTTLVHEAGHAMHSNAEASETIFHYKHTPQEVSELASMSMEYLTMNYWDEYYSNPEDLKKAKRDQLMSSIKFLPWCMIIDAFQHWIYMNPDHSADERLAYFGQLMDRFYPDINWSGLDREKQISWMRQLHIFEVPFYYIEYGMAQLGALAVYKNYKENPAEAVEEYKSFLNLGYSKPVRELYETAGVQFDFSEGYIAEIVEFVKGELEQLH